MRFRHSRWERLKHFYKLLMRVSGQSPHLAITRGHNHIVVRWNSDDYPDLQLPEQTSLPALERYAVSLASGSAEYPIPLWLHSPRRLTVALECDSTFCKDYWSSTLNADGLVIGIPTRGTVYVNFTKGRVAYTSFDAAYGRVRQWLLNRRYDREAVLLGVDNSPFLEELLKTSTKRFKHNCDLATGLIKKHRAEEDVTA